MNFRTTIILIILLAGAGAYVAVRQLSGGNKEAEARTSTTGKLVGMETADVTKLSITPADGQKIVAEKSGTQWRLVEPIKAPADQFTVEAWVNPSSVNTDQAIFGRYTLAAPGSSAYHLGVTPGGSLIFQVFYSIT